MHSNAFYFSSLYNSMAVTLPHPFCYNAATSHSKSKFSKSISEYRITSQLFYQKHFPFFSIIKSLVHVQVGRLLLEQCWLSKVFFSKLHPPHHWSASTTGALTSCRGELTGKYPFLVRAYDPWLEIFKYLKYIDSQIPKNC